MRRVLPSGVGLALFLTAGVAGAGGAPGWVAFTTVASPGRIVLVGADGSESHPVSPAAYAFDPSWAPDGSRLTFAMNAGSGAADIFTVRPDGSDLQRVTNDSVSAGGITAVGNIQPSYSPDGARLVFMKLVTATAPGGPTVSNFDVWTTRGDGTDPTRITTDGGDKRGVSWQPHGRLLAYTYRDPDGSYYVSVVPALGGAPRRLARVAAFSFDVEWSPDGNRLLILDPIGNPAVLDPDGGHYRTLTSRVTSMPHWSADGASAVYAGRRVFAEIPTRYGPFTTTDVFSLDIASGSERRLTGDLDERSFLNSQNGSPLPWPDGSRIFFISPRGGGLLRMMNPDGTCEQPWAPQAREPLFGPVWQPNAKPGLGPLACAELRVHGSVDVDAIALRAPATGTITVENDGNLQATGLTVTIGTDHGSLTSRDSHCSASTAALTCTLDDLAPQASTTLDFQFAAATAGQLQPTVTATTRTFDPTADDNTIPLTTVVLPCSLVGTPGADTLIGTAGGDSICGLPGADQLYGRAGNDYLSGGSGPDTIYAGTGRDVVLGGGGRDVIFARDGRRDELDCGTEFDVAIVDRVDGTKNCERVLRG